MKPVEDLKAVSAREKEKIGKDNPILVSESMYDTAVRIQGVGVQPDFRR